MKKDPKIFLFHILESIAEIENYIRGISKKDFFKDRKTQDAVIRRLEIIGEAVKNLPLDLKNAYHQIRWQEIAGMRDLLIHEYFGIDLNIVWLTAQKDIPFLKKQIFKLSEFLKE